ncbi:MAG: magnetosome biogenesis CDF transporter MamB [Magnetospirillum sp. WYHS-4]
MKSENCKQCRDEVIWWAIVVNIAQTAFKGMLGVLSGSAALIADSMHSGADVVASITTMVSVKLSSRPPDDEHPYGYGSVQFISSSIVGLILIMGAVYLMYESVVKIVAGNMTSPSPFAILGALVSIATNELMYRYQYCVGRENNSPAIVANAWDNRSDALSSLGVLIGLVAAVAGFPVADNLAAVVVGVLVAKIGVELNIEALSGLMDSSVEMDVLIETFNIASGTPLVRDVHYLRGRNVGEDMHLDIGICVDNDKKIYEADIIAEAVRNRIFANIEHVRDVRVTVFPTHVAKKAARKDGIQAAMASAS